LSLALSSVLIYSLKKRAHDTCFWIPIFQDDPAKKAKMHFLFTQVLPTVSLIVVPLFFAKPSRSAPTPGALSTQVEGFSTPSLDERAIISAPTKYIEDLSKEQLVEVTVVQRDISAGEISGAESNVLLHPRKRWGGWGGGGCCGGRGW
jgi:hypothetical protein